MAFLNIKQALLLFNGIARSVSLFNLDHSFEEVLPRSVSQD
jgi:hypothetical protein